jgi:hypothetical protein
MVDSVLIADFKFFNRIWGEVYHRGRVPATSGSRIVPWPLLLALVLRITTPLAKLNSK